MQFQLHQGTTVATALVDRIPPHAVGATQAELLRRGKVIESELTGEAPSQIERRSQYLIAAKFDPKRSEAAFNARALGVLITVRGNPQRGAPALQ